MIYIIPTKHGMGVELWGTHDDLSDLHDIISRFWNDENSITIKGYENRGKLISGFSYEIRKAYEASRLKRKSSHYSFDEIDHFGTEISWVHFLFSLSAIKYNMRYRDISKYDISLILQLEFWLEKAMNNYDEIGARNLIGFIEDGIYGANEFIYHYMRSINLDYYLLGGGKRTFRKLPELLRRGIFFTTEYKSYRSFLEEDAKRLNCTIDELELDDNDIDYDSVKW